MGKYKYKGIPGIFEWLFYTSGGTVDDKKEKQFEEMEKEGYRLVDFHALRGWQFEQAAPRNYIYSFDVNRDVHPNLTHRKSEWMEYNGIFAGAGWEYVCSKGDCHIFRAPSGTPPIYSDNEGLAAKYSQQRRMYIWQIFANVVFGIFFIYVSFLPDVTYNHIFGGLGVFFMVSAVIIGRKALAKNRNMRAKLMPKN